MSDKKDWLKYLQGERIPSLEDDEADKRRSDSNIFEVILDLHNHTEDQAYKALIAAVKNSKELNCNRIKVITGKGSFFPIKPGRLFFIVPQWLDAIQESGLIKSFKQEEGIIDIKF